MLQVMSDTHSNTCFNALISILSTQPSENTLGKVTAKTNQMSMNNSTSLRSAEGS